MRVVFVSHPEVAVDPAVPVPLWSLSAEGTARARALARRLAAPAAIWSSPEAKAIETAGLLAAPHGLGISVHPGLAEIDRSATGFVSHARHAALADACFAAPELSAAGWERAVDATARVVAAYRAIMAGMRGGAVLLVGHGGTGTLLWCALAGLGIARAHDQPGQGHAWAWNHAAGTPLFAWTPLEAVPPALAGGADAA
jgi:broad specificity phosphatase PhoE